MGLCKCPKRQVTNQFCFEHRVNVCEHCMVASHPKCIVQSYLQWLKDSDYNSSCTLCDTALENEDCTRLICFHVFHWPCIDARQSSLPSNTAPGGHQCPTCSQPIFPPANLVSPVADVLRSRLGQVNWGRNELGLPLLSDDSNKTQLIHKPLDPSNSSQSSVVFNQKKSNINMTAPETQSRSHSILHMDAFNPHASSRRPLLPRESPIGGSDRDDNKYQRRTPREIFHRWTLRLFAPSPRSFFGRPWLRNLLIVVLFIVFIYLVATFGRKSASRDPTLEIQDPNPHFE